MKKGKIILGVAAFVVTAGVSIAFELNNKFHGHMRLYGATRPGSKYCTLSTCATLSSGRDASPCKTAIKNIKTALPEAAIPYGQAEQTSILNVAWVHGEAGRISNDKKESYLTCSQII